MTITKRDALQLVDDIRRANVAGHAIAARACGAPRPGITDAAFMGGLEAVLCHFLHQQGRSDVAKALSDAMSRAPTPQEIAARNAEINKLGKTAA